MRKRATCRLNYRAEQQCRIHAASSGTHLANIALLDGQILSLTANPPLPFRRSAEQVTNDRYLRLSGAQFSDIDQKIEIRLLRITHRLAACHAQPIARRPS
jgi:hypothetical protein